MEREKSLALVIGAGSGLGSAVMQIFSANDYHVVGINRSAHNDNKTDHEIKVLDVADSEQTKKVIDECCAQYGAPKVVIFNTAELVIKPFLETSHAEFENSWRAMTLAAFNVLQVAIPHMLTLDKSHIIVSGATGSLRGGANFSAFVSAKFALRGLVQSVAREYQKQGVHIVHVILDGILDTPRSRELHSLDPSKMMSVDDVAEVYLQLTNQSPSTWTHELDLRPLMETF